MEGRGVGGLGGGEWGALMARRHSWLQTPKDRETERVRDRQKEGEREKEREGGKEREDDKNRGGEGKRERERRLVIATDE